MADEEVQRAQRTEVNDTHRLPTLSASEALKKARGDSPRTISTGLARLDVQLNPRGLANISSTSGLPLGQVTELYGPPGSGKTSFGLQLCASVIRQGGQAVWIDTATPLARDRLNAFTTSSTGNTDASQPTVDQSHSKPLHRFTAPTLPHLLALLLRGTPASLGDNVRLIVVDTISSPFERAYIRDHRNSSSSEASKWAAGRKFAVMGELIRELGKVAVMLDLAVVLLCQCATKLRPGAPAIFLPSISGHEWENGIANRVLLYRDWLPPQHTMPGRPDLNSCHYAMVCKAGGTQTDSASTTAVAFTVTKRGLSELPSQETPHVSTVPSPARPKKRNYVEIADSDAEDLTDDDYSWMNEDEVAAENAPADAEPAND